MESAIQWGQVQYAALRCTNGLWRTGWVNRSGNYCRPRLLPGVGSAKDKRCWNAGSGELS